MYECVDTALPGLVSSSLRPESLITADDCFELIATGAVGGLELRKTLRTLATGDPRRVEPGEQDKPGGNR